MRLMIKNWYRPWKSYMRNFNTEKVLRWILILEECFSEIKYIHGKKIMVADVPSKFAINGNQGTTQESNYAK